MYSTQMNSKKKPAADDFKHWEHRCVRVYKIPGNTQCHTLRNGNSCHVQDYVLWWLLYLVLVISFVFDLYDWTSPCENTSDMSTDKAPRSKSCTLVGYDNLPAHKLVTIMESALHANKSVCSLLVRISWLYWKCPFSFSICWKCQVHASCHHHVSAGWCCHNSLFDRWSKPHSTDKVVCRFIICLELCWFDICIAATLHACTPQVL